MMNEPSYATAPEWAQACMVIGEMLRAFAGRGGTQTIVSLTAEQSDAVRFADAFMTGRASDLAVVILDRLLRPLDEMPYCDDKDCLTVNPGCHVHKPDVAAALVRRWVEIGSPRAKAHAAVESLDDAWEAINRLARCVGRDGDRRFLEGLAEAAFNRAREIVKAEIPATEREVTEAEVERLARMRKAMGRGGKVKSTKAVIGNANPWDALANLRRDNARLRRILRSWLSECDRLDVNGGAYSRARVVTANDLLAALKGDAPPKGRAR